MNRTVSTIISYWPTVVVIVAIFLVWQEVTVIFKIPPYIFPPPVSVLKEMFSSKVHWVANAWATLYESSAGFLIAVAFGIPISILLVLSKTVNRILQPIIILIQVSPRAAIAPVIFLVLGFTYTSRIVIVFLIAFFPIIIQTIAGLNSLDPDFVNLLNSLGASKWKVIFRGRFPQSIPYIFDGLKVAITLAVIGAVVAEFVQADLGLGYLMLEGLVQYGPVIVFAALFWISIMGLLMYLGILIAERLSIPWYFKSKHIGYEE